MTKLDSSSEQDLQHTALSPERASRVLEIVSARYAAILPLIQLSEISHKTRFPHLLPDGIAVNSWSESVAWSADKSGVSKKTIWKFWSNFRAHGREGLMPRSRKDRGRSRIFSNHAKLCCFAAYLFLVHTRNIRAVHKAISDFHGQLGDRPISYSSVRRWLLNTPRQELVAFALEGQRRFRAVVVGFTKGMKAA
jgi:hypothetical protein